MSRDTQAACAHALLFNFGAEMATMPWLCISKHQSVRFSTKFTYTHTEIFLIVNVIGIILGPQYY